jgi:leucyl-tRNA synthetase
LDFIDYPKSTINAQRAWFENQHDWCVSRQRKWGCPIPIEGETDTLDTFVDSSFYFVRYCDSENENELCSPEKYKQVDLYVGGNEHACMHLIYARFINMFLYDIGIVSEEEPFKKVIHQGMILNNGEKMSKSKGNVVNPDDYDSDVLRFYLMFIGHYFDGGSWSDKNISGIKRFINKFKDWMNKPDGSDSIDIDKFKKTVFDNTELFKFNKVVSSFMIFTNENKDKNITANCKKELIDILSIFMPSIKEKIK